MTTAEKLGRIMELSVRINEETDFIVFTRFAGHVKEVSIDIAPKSNYLDYVASAEISNFSWNKNADMQYDQLIMDLEFVLKCNMIPAYIPAYSAHESFNKHGLCKRKLSQGCNLNESTLQNTSTEAYLSFDKAAREA